MTDVALEEKVLSTESGTNLSQEQNDDLDKAVQVSFPKDVKGGEEEDDSTMDAGFEKDSISEETIADDEDNVDDDEDSIDDKDAESGDDDEDEDSAEDVDLPDGLIERLVISGLSLADAKKIKDPQLAKIFIDRSTAADNKGGQDDQDTEAVKTPRQMLDSIPKLNEEDYDPVIVDQNNSLREVLETVISKQESQDKTRLDKEDSANEQKMDAMFATQPAQWKKFFGEGSIAGLSPKQQVRRAKVIGMVDIAKDAIKARGEVATEASAFKLAMEYAHPDRKTQIERTKLTTKLKKRSGQHISRSGGKAPANTESPEAEAARIVDEKYGS